MNLKKYKCHKEVEAAKISRVEYMSLKEAGESEIKPNGAMLYVDEMIQPITVDQDWIARRLGGIDPVGGYFIEYLDGYTSWSPAEAFESGYVLAQDEGFEQRLLKERDELKTNAKRLGAFLDSDSVNDISTEHHQLLADQFDLMNDYEAALSRRIELLDII